MSIGGGLISIVMWLCCLLGCLAVGIAIIIGIVVILKRSKGTDADDVAPPANDVESQPDESPEEDASPEEDTQQVPEVGEASPTPSAEVKEEVPEPPAAEAAPVNPKAAGQTIIAFDDDDEDF
tara:strand:- start:11 stop:379 length:369 start_codon:yes stop_codon:yes gene_type:complete